MSIQPRITVNREPLEAQIIVENFTTGTVFLERAEGLVGWRIKGDGDAEFNSVVVRNGDIVNGSHNNFKYKTNFETPPGPATFNNYAISNKAALMIAPTDGTITLTGIISLDDGSVIVISNRGNANLVLSHQSTSSTAANRIITPTGSNYTIAPNHGAMIIYDDLSNRWRFLCAT